MSNILRINIDQKIQEANNIIAQRIREKRQQYNLPMVDIQGSVGSGKTSILEYFAEKYVSTLKFLVINGDLATDIDAQRIGRFGSTCLQINTGRGCHLMAFQIEKALSEVDLNTFDFIFVENVGNLICPSTTDVGADSKITVTSVTEGPYVFRKHPITFKMSQLAILNKIDLAPAMEIDVDEVIEGAHDLYPQLEIIQTSVKTGVGMDLFAKKIGLETKKKKEKGRN
ncbi:MAG: hydrogenase nickel incorporation protein HypB [Candidatus Heimdallarchaeota archaeon]|nr:MAG: hydrogenase nickel incorporation protein HypB [Candidatus Heimdallarchaeota archaeon]